jgi:glycine/serine hydroxymethyltransferase
MVRVLAAPDDDRVAQTVKTEVDRLCHNFPLYADR